MEKALSKFSKEYIHYLKMKPALNFRSSAQVSISKKQFSMLTWNTLASGYTSPSTYYYVKPDYLNEEHRMNMITYDLIRSNCDIICLQEIEKRNYENFFKKQLEGYDSKYKINIGIYEKRTGFTCDGLSIFYRKELFKQADYFKIDLNKFSIISNLNYLKDFNKTNNIAQVLVLEPRVSSFNFHLLCVVNLHLHWDPEKELIKYLQAAEIKFQINNFLKSIKCDGENIPIVIGGDFNSLPESSVIDIVTHKFNEENIANKEELNIYQSVFKKTNNLNLIDCHKINNSSYVTNIKNDFRGQIDYIFYSKDLSLNSQVSYIDISNYIEEQALPNSFHGSDHLYLISDFFV